MYSRIRVVKLLHSGDSLSCSLICLGSSIGVPLGWDLVFSWRGLFCAAFTVDDRNQLLALPLVSSLLAETSGFGRGFEAS
ncbi:hypothetical protein R1flu_014433 [Riccia fluitans]|uniref:Uncharacterized protein n=1 Tax=Riccia fluitans TaxID=41844 RepID=A0ABD1YG73_9MARC